MKQARQFLPLLKSALGFYSFGPLFLLAWLGLSTALLFCAQSFSPLLWMEDHAHQNLFGDGQLLFAVILWVWLFLACSPTLFELINGMPALRAIEFLFTRGIDRKYFCRAQVVAGVLIVQGPLILNLVLSPLKDELIFGPGVSTTPAAVAAQRRYEAVFPGSIHTHAKDAERSELLIVRHGTVAFAAWLIWAETLGAALVAGYHALVVRKLQRAGLHYTQDTRRRWLAGGIVLAPIFLGTALVVACGLNRFDVYEESFLLFARHPLFLMALALGVRYAVVLPVMERRMNQYEYL